MESTLGQLPVKNVLKGLLDQTVIDLMKRVLQRKFSLKETIRFSHATAIAKVLQSHSTKAKHSADLRETFAVLYRLQRKHMEEALKVVKAVTEKPTSMVTVSEAHVEKLKRVAGLLYPKEHEFLDSVLEQQRLGYSLSAKQLAWLGKIDFRFQSMQRAAAYSIPVTGGFR